MSKTVNFAATVTAFAAAVAALETVVITSPERATRLQKIVDRIEADAALATKVANFKVTSKANVQDFKAGDEVEFSVGRGETVRSGLRGVVLGVREKAEGVIPAVKVRVGSGFDEEVYTTHPSNVALIGQVPAAAEVSEEDQLDLLEGTVEA